LCYGSVDFVVVVDSGDVDNDVNTGCHNKKQLYFYYPEYLEHTSDISKMSSAETMV